MRISEPILIAASTPFDTGPFQPRTHVKVEVWFYADAGGSSGARIAGSAGGARDGDYTTIESVHASGSALTPYTEGDVRSQGTAPTAIVMLAGRWGTIQELGGVTRLEIVAAPQGPPDDAPGAVSYRIWVDVEARP